MSEYVKIGPGNYVFGEDLSIGKCDVIWVSGYGQISIEGRNFYDHYCVGRPPNSISNTRNEEDCIYEVRNISGKAREKIHIDGSLICMLCPPHAIESLTDTKYNAAYDRCNHIYNESNPTSGLAPEMRDEASTVDMFADNWKKEPTLIPFIEEIDFRASDFIEKSSVYSRDNIVIHRTAICNNLDTIVFHIKETHDKSYYATKKFSMSIGAYVDLGGDYEVRLDYHKIDDISFVASCLGDKPGYYNIPRVYPQVHEFLVVNHPLYALAEKIKSLLDDFGKSPSVFYAQPVKRGREIVNDFRKLHQQKIDEVYNEALGSGDVPIKWKSEYVLYVMIKAHYPDAVFQFKDKWLGQQSLDIFIPSKKVAIEYQGQQHFAPLEVFGGERAFAKNLERDKNKNEKCVEAGITLLYWNYDVAITDENFVVEIASKIK